MSLHKVVLESERLYVCAWLEEDGQPLYRVMSEPAVHRYTAEDPWTETQTQEMIAARIEHECRARAR